MKITFVDGDCWQGLYIDNKIKLQTHHLSIVEILETIGVDFDYIIPDQDWLDEVGQLPKNLKQVKEYKE